MMKNKIKYLAILALGMIACEQEFDKPITDADFYSSGDADFSKYVAVGNSLTAGYADGSLYITGQNNSYPNILANQLKLAGGGEFTQPLMADNTGGLLMNGTLITGFENRFVLNKEKLPVRYTGANPTSDIAKPLTGKGTFNNMGVPGAKSFHLVNNNYGNIAGAPTSANPYFVRFASTTNASVIGDAIAQKPTFFSLWIGNNDILSYATSGGIGEDHNATGNTNPSTYGDKDITHNNVFAQIYSQLVDSLVATGAKGVLINLANVTSIPYFTTVPFAPLSPLDPDFAPQIPALNAEYAGLNQAFAFLGVPERSIQFSNTAASAVVIKDESLTDLSAQLIQVLTPSQGAAKATILGMQYGQSRQATAEDLLVLTSSQVIGKVNPERVAYLMGLGLPQDQAGKLSVNGVTYPLEDQYVLIPTEIAAISTAQASYNATIKGLATAKKLAFYDAAADLAQVANGGIPFDGGVVTDKFATGGGFSLDGVHPTPRGYAMVAKGMIKVIESTYNAKLPSINPGDYGSITLND